MIMSHKLPGVSVDRGCKERAWPIQS
jgi:hypothetical protein